jgi:hypothetical protein
MQYNMIIPDEGFRWVWIESQQGDNIGYYLGWNPCGWQHVVSSLPFTDDNKIKVWFANDIELITLAEPGRYWAPGDLPLSVRTYHCSVEQP